MRHAGIVLLFACTLMPSFAQDKKDGPTDEKAQKSYKQGLDFVKVHMTESALNCFKKADKQDGGKCLACQKMMIKYGNELHDWKTAEAGAEEMLKEAHEPNDLAVVHYQLGMILLSEAVDENKNELFSRAHDELTKALAEAANFPDAMFADGQALAYLKQDDAAKAQFERYIKFKAPSDPNRQRALLYISRPELARSKLAPAFAVTTIDGQHVSLDNLKGKVVLIDFWATWCGPCREALPHMQEIVRKFEGQPLVVLSVSLDSDEKAWKDFIAKHEMMWLNCRDGGFDGPVSKLFGVSAIPHTFTIDADGLLQEEHIGDASIEGKLKKLLERARQLQETQKQP